jgi:hypothetical protein
MDEANEVRTADDDLAARPVGGPATIPDYSTLRPARVPTPMGALAVVAVKIVGLYCFVQALPLVYQIPSNVILLFTGNGVGTVDSVLFLLHPLLYVGAGVVLVRHATWVATRVLGFEEPPDDLRARAPGRLLQSIAFAVLGVWLTVEGLVEVVRLLVQARYYAVSTGTDVFQSVLEEPSSVAAAGTRLAIGVGLFVGSKRLARFWAVLRSPVGGRQPEPIP